MDVLANYDVSHEGSIVLYEPLYHSSWSRLLVGISLLRQSTCSLKFVAYFPFHL